MNTLKPIHIILLCLFLGGMIPIKPRPEVLIKAPNFTVLYSEELQQPLGVEYWVKCTTTLFSRKGMDFYVCDSVITSDALDYEGNEWDKGHMAPAADFACEKDALYSTFTYLNCALQQQDLNRGAWRLLEERERTLAQSAPTHVKIIVHFSTKSQKLSSGATVPDGFTKFITSGKLQEKYYFPNTKPSGTDYKKYLVGSK